MRYRLIIGLALGALAAACVLSPRTATAAPACGDGVVDANEECDGGGPLFLDGDPAGTACTNGSRCYFQFTCCKFNCQYVGTPGAPCEDGNNCSGPDTCNQVGVCLGGPDAANDTPCDDGLFCTGVESCQDGVCLSSTGDPCPGTACNKCQEDTDSCLDPAGVPCSSGDTCVTGGNCDGAGSCLGGIFNTNPCDDGLYCNGADSCDGGACRLHAGDPCPGGDGDANCSESCNEDTDTCDADDSAGAPCNDGLFCNGAGDTCNAGACEGTGTAACDDGNSCTTDFCNEASDSCTGATLPDGTACSDGDACTLDDLCSAGACVGDETLVEDFCPWALLHREQPRSDRVRTGFQVSVVGDVCAGTIRLGGQNNIASDLVSGEAEGLSDLRLAPDSTIGDDIVSAGSGAEAFQGSGFLPYLDPPTPTLAPGSLVGKADATGSYDLTGTHPLVAPCVEARNAFEANTAFFDALPATQASIPLLKIPTGQSYVIAAGNPGGVNVVDIDRSLRAGTDSVLELDGGGDPETVMILRVSGKAKLLLRSSLVLSGGLLPEHTLLYVRGGGCRISDLVLGSGTVLCSPGRVKTGLSVAWVGAIFADGRTLKVGDKAFFLHSPFQGF